MTAVEDAGWLAQPKQTIRGRLSTIDEPSDTVLSEPNTVTLMGTLGVGGMAVVHLGKQATLDREVAVKMPRADRPSGEARRRLMREALITGKLQHPNIVPVHDVQLSEDGFPQIILKRIEGASWADILHRPLIASKIIKDRDPLEFHIRVLISVCNAIGFAHSHNIIHRDIKPDNVMIGEFGEVLVLDWGIASPLKGTNPPSTRPRGILGTPAYMAPEMVAVRPHTVQTDIYLLGATLYEILSGDPPHQGRTMEEMLNSVVSRRPLPDAAPPALARLCEQAMAIHQTERPTSVTVFQEGLERYLEQRAVEAILHVSFQQLEGLRSALHQADDESEIIERFSSCRFGFTHVLRIQPDAPRARQGLDACLHLMATWTLGRQNLNLAAHYLSQIHEPDDDLREAIEHAQRLETERRSELDALYEEYDQSRGNRGRLLGIGFILLSAAFVSGSLIFIESPSYLEFGITSIILFLIIVGTAFLLRRALFPSIFNQRIFLMIASFPLIQTMIDLSSWYRGWPPRDSHAMALFLLMLVFLHSGVQMDRRWLYVAPIHGSMWLLSALRPEYTYILICFGAILSISVVLLMWHHHTSTPSGNHPF